MKVTLNWLKQYVDFDWSPEELAERLTMLGLEVEGVRKIAGAFDGVVVAQVITRDKHPNADKLSVCRVNDGKGERQIVCGAQNFQAGDKVPLILPGATLPPKAGETAPFTIKVGKLRGVESHGMMCSHDELSIEPEAIGLKREEGLLILRPDAVVGQSFAEYLGRAGGDVVFDLEVTPNRPDLNSAIGIAREIAAVTNGALRLPSVELPAAVGAPASTLVGVRIEAPDLCPRYTARVVRGVKIGPSPDWLRSTLEKVGIRSISNVVDVTNYVMMEVGQPLHAFDCHLLGQASRLSQTSEPTDGDRRDACPTIVVRRAAPEEVFTTLDNQKHTLDGEMMLIADEQKGIALAGIMGGLNTEINDQTVDVLIESACFNPTSIRRTAKKLGLRTESSYRFERGADIGISDWASRRCAQLILETAGGQLAEGVVDAYPAPAEPKKITLRHQKVNDLLGITLAPDLMEDYLFRLGLRNASRKPRPVDAQPSVEPATFQIPTWRVDLKRETDLIEEIERLHGLEKIPATPPRGAIGSNAFDSVHDQIADARRIMTGMGLNEAQGQTLISNTAATLFASTAPDGTAVPLVLLANPLSSDMSTLRPSLLPGLLDSLRHNLARQNHDVALFEVGRVFASSNGRPKEERRLAIALTGQRSPLFWSGDERNAKFDLHDLKGLLEEFLEQFGLRGLQFTRRAESTPTMLESAAIGFPGKQSIGEIGQLLPALARQHDLRDPVMLAELSLDQLIARRNPAKAFKPLPAFPSVRRDVAMFVPESVTHDAVLSVVKQAKPANLESVDLFDVFRGKHVPAGQKSLAYAFTYRSAERTLTDAEVNTAQEKLVADLKSKLGATVRDT